MKKLKVSILLMLMLSVICIASTPAAPVNAATTSADLGESLFYGKGLLTVRGIYAFDRSTVASSSTGALTDFNGASYEQLTTYYSMQYISRAYYTFPDLTTITGYHVSLGATSRYLYIELFDADFKLLSRQSALVNNVKTPITNVTGVKYATIVLADSTEYTTVYEFHVFGVPADKNPPSVPTNLNATPHDGSTVLTWSPSKDPEGSAVTYDVFMDGSKVTPSKIGATTLTVNGVSPDTLHSFHVVAYDSFGNASLESSKVTSYLDTSPKITLTLGMNADVVPIHIVNYKPEQEISTFNLLPYGYGTLE
jgi:hypothetical protein